MDNWQLTDSLFIVYDLQLKSLNMLINVLVLIKV